MKYHPRLYKKSLKKMLQIWSLSQAQKQQNLQGMVRKLRQYVPDISVQESREKPGHNDLLELRRRNLHGFQCSLMLEALKNVTASKMTVVDIGDSAGTHMLYLKALTSDMLDLDSLSINLDPIAINKIRARGLKAILKRAEDIHPEDIGKGNVELFTSFQMIEHLHNPAIFLRRLAANNLCSLMVITVPFLRSSRIGLHRLRNRSKKAIFAQDEHIFELSSDDWTLLFLHSGWQVITSRIYYQYPTRYPIITTLLRKFWQQTDFEGFWGAILQKDLSWSDLYQDWEA